MLLLELLLLLLELLELRELLATLRLLELLGCRLGWAWLGGFGRDWFRASVPLRELDSVLGELVTRLDDRTTGLGSDALEVRVIWLVLISLRASLLRARRLARSSRDTAGAGEDGLAARVISG